MADDVKRTYCIMQPVGNDAPKMFGKYDSFLCRWCDVDAFVKQYLDDIEMERSVTLRFTLRSWTDEEFEKYCADNGIQPF